MRLRQCSILVGESFSHRLGYPSLLYVLDLCATPATEVQSIDGVEISETKRVIDNVVPVPFVDHSDGLAVPIFWPRIITRVV